MKHHFRWTVGLLLFLAGMLNYIDRAAMSVAAPFIKHDLHLDDTRLGLLFSVFFVGYCLSCFLGGWCADRFGPKRVLASAGGMWTVFCGATGLVTTFWQLLGVRAFFGIGEGPMGTTINKSITNWFPREEAGRAVGIIATGQPLGAALAAPFIGLLALSWGWRIAFAGTAFLGFVWLAAWLLLFQDTPAQHPWVSAEERAHIEASRASGPAPAVSAGRSGWRDVFSARVLGVALAFLSFNYILYFLLSWLPSYLVDYQHLDIRHMAVIGAIPWLGAAVGLVSGGILPDLLARVMRDALLARKAIIFLGLSGSALGALHPARPPGRDRGRRRGAHRRRQPAGVPDAANLLGAGAGDRAVGSRRRHRWFRASAGESRGRAADRPGVQRRAELRAGTVWRGRRLRSDEQQHRRQQYREPEVGGSGRQLWAGQGEGVYRLSFPALRRGLFADLRRRARRGTERDLRQPVLGVRYQFTTPLSATAAAYYQNYRGVGGEAMFELVGNYAFSKRTDVYALAAVTTNSRRTNLGVDGIGTAETGARQTGIVIGLRHRF